MKMLAVVFIFLNAALFAGLPDLAEFSQDFILETKKIHIPGCQDAFNPSIIRFKGELLLCFRIRDPVTLSTHEIGIVFLDENFDPVGHVRKLKVPSLFPTAVLKTQDPRLIRVKEEIYVVYNDAAFVFEKEIRRMFAGRLSFDGIDFRVEAPEVFLNFKGALNDKHEKNWVPFDYEGHLMFGYSIVPHRILKPVFGEQRCREVACTEAEISWDLGELRGGTPVLLEGEEYLAFFHSCKDMKTVQSDGKKITHYFMGAYMFSAEPPFSLTRISKEPLVAKTFYTEPFYKTWKPLRVVFPDGFVSDENTLVVAYGRQDHEVWIVKIDKQALIASLAFVVSR